jgi:hypothetical protein
LTAKKIVGKDKHGSNIWLCECSCGNSNKVVTHDLIRGNTKSCGCLVDDTSLAMSYNNANLKRPVLGVGLIINSLPILEPMLLDSKGNWVFN